MLPWSPCRATQMVSWSVSLMSPPRCRGNVELIMKITGYSFIQGGYCSLLQAAGNRADGNLPSGATLQRGSWPGQNMKRKYTLGEIDCQGVGRPLPGAGICPGGQEAVSQSSCVQAQFFRHLLAQVFESLPRYGDLVELRAHGCVPAPGPPSCGGYLEVKPVDEVVCLFLFFSLPFK